MSSRLIYLSQLISKYNSNWLMRIFLMLALLLLWIFNFSTWPVSNPTLMKISGQEGLLDLLLFYSPQEAFSAFTNYGEVGRDLYLNFIAADFIFIFIYSIGLSFLITSLVQKVCCDSSVWLILNLVPLGIGLFDAVENLSIFAMLIIYPEVNTYVATVAGTSTLCKHILSIFALMILGYGGLILLFRHCGIKLCRSHR